MGNMRLNLLIPIIAGTVHFGFCLAMADFLNSPHGESWGWFPIFALDFPISILVLIFLQGLPPLLAYGVLGSIWWALIAFLFIKVLDHLRARKRSSSIKESDQI